MNLMFSTYLRVCVQIFFLEKSLFMGKKGGNYLLLFGECDVMSC